MKNNFIKLKEHLIEKYDNIIRTGKTHDEALMEVSDYCYKMATYPKGLLSEDQFEYPKFSQIVTKLSKEKYSQALIPILERWTKQAEKSLNPTNKSCKNIITMFANEILSLKNTKVVFDPAIGSGYLLYDINTNLIIGQDINKRLSKFAENFLNLKNFNTQIENNNSIEIFTDPHNIKITKPIYDKNNKEIGDVCLRNIWDNAGLFIFDPPIGIKMRKPIDWDNKKVDEIIGFSNNNIISSELIFLINFLLYSQTGSYCLCKMPSSLLSSRQKDLDNLRYFLIKNDILVAVIKDNNYVILVLTRPIKGNNDNDKDIVLLNGKDLTLDIVKNTVHNNFEVLDHNWIHNKKSLLDNLSGNIIPIESFEYSQKEIKSPVFYYNKIILNEKDISANLKIIRDRLREHNIIYLTKEESDILEETILQKENSSAIEYIIEQDSISEDKITSIDSSYIEHWFLDKQNETSELAKAMRYLYPYMEGLEYIVDKHQTSLFFTRNLLSGNIKTLFNYIRVLYDNKKIRKTKVNIGNKYDNKIILEIKLEPKNDKFDIKGSYLSLVNPIVYFTKEYRKAYYLLSKEQKLLYIKLCQHWFNNEKTNENDLFENYSYADLSRNIKTFNDIGLVIYENENTNKYDEYRPIHPLIDNVDNVEDD